MTSRSSQAFIPVLTTSRFNFWPPSPLWGWFQVSPPHRYTLYWPTSPKLVWTFGNPLIRISDSSLWLFALKMAHVPSSDKSLLIPQVCTNDSALTLISRKTHKDLKAYLNEWYCTYTISPLAIQDIIPMASLTKVWRFAQEIVHVRNCILSLLGIKSLLFCIRWLDGCIKESLLLGHPLTYIPHSRLLFYRNQTGEPVSCVLVFLTSEGNVSTLKSGITKDYPWPTLCGTIMIATIQVWTM